MVSSTLTTALLATTEAITAREKDGWLLKKHQGGLLSLEQKHRTSFSRNG